MTISPTHDLIDPQSQPTAILIFIEMLPGFKQILDKYG